MLQPKILEAKALANGKLLLTYETNECKLFDVTPYIQGDWFGLLRDEAYFRRVAVADGWTVEWPDGQDISPQELYENSILQ